MMATKGAKMATSTLNMTAGKATSSQTKRKLNPQDISFTPAKKARTGGGLNRKSLTTARKLRPRQSSLSLPEDTPPEKDEPTRKRVLKLKTSKESTGNESPLKDLGFSPKDTAAPGRVNLNESPAKGLRSRNAHVFPPKNSEASSASITTPVKRSTRLSVKNGEIEAPPEMGDNNRQAASASGIEEDDHLEQKVEEDQGQAVDDDSDEYFSPQTSIKSATEAMETESSSEKPARKQKEDNDSTTGSEAISRRQNGAASNALEVNTNRETKPPAEDKAQSKKQKKSRKQDPSSANREVTQLEDEEKRQEHAKIFVSPIQDMIHWHDCTEDWCSIGGASEKMRIEYGSLPFKSAHCQSIDRMLSGLTNLFQKLFHGKVDVDILKPSITKAIARLESACNDLELETDTTTGDDIVTDLYHRTITNVVYLIRDYMKCFDNEEELFSGWELRHFVYLLQILNNLTKQAATWQPKPTTLANKLMEDMRKYVRPQVRRILKKYKYLLEEMDGREDMETQMRELKAVQKAALAAHAQRKQGMYDKIRENKYGSRSSPQPEAMNAIFDIDDLEWSDRPDIARRPRRHGPPTRSAKPRFERQGTEDIAPPPADWTEDEKAALLNALEIYRGEDRYWEIQDACVELQSRSLDDLRTAALYFRELILNAGEFAGQHQSTFEYLLSVK